MSESLSMTSLERRTVIALGGLYALRMLGLFMVLPVLPLAVEHYQGADAATIGLALGAYGLAQGLLQIPFGWWSDRLGRKPVIVLGLLLFAAGSLLAWQASQIWEVILGRFLQGSGAIAAALMALMSDLTRDEVRTRAMASIGLSIGLAFACALVAGPLLASVVGVSGIFALTAILAVGGIGVLLKWVPTPQQTQLQRDNVAVPETIKRCLGNLELWRLYVGIFALHAALVALFTWVPGRLLTVLNLEPALHWLVYLPTMGLGFLTMVPFIIMAERGRFKPVFVSGVLVLLLTFIWLAQLDGDESVALVMALWVFFWAFNLMEASLPSLVSKLAPAGSKGSAMGVYTTFQFLGAFVGGAGGGWLNQQAGMSAALWMSAALIAVWLLLAVTMQPPGRVRTLTLQLDEDPTLRQRQAERLRHAPEVVELLLVEGERQAYLKVASGVQASDLQPLLRPEPISV